jgi:hypothetical protein
MVWPGYPSGAGTCLHNGEQRQRWQRSGSAADGIELTLVRWHPTSDDRLVTNTASESTGAPQADPTQAQAQAAMQSRRRFLGRGLSAVTGLVVVGPITGLLWSFGTQKDGWTRLDGTGKTIGGPNDPTFYEGPFGAGSGVFVFSYPHTQSPQAADANQVGPIALSARCPRRHARLAFCPSSSYFECPTCGSRFTMSGDVVSGPAGQGIGRYPVRVRSDGSVELDVLRVTRGAAYDTVLVSDWWREHAYPEDSECIVP